MTLPNFLIFGAGKAGTTSVYHYLKQHPQVFMSAVKEPRFFVYDPAKHGDDAEMANYFQYRTRAQYEPLFAQAGDAKAIGEGSIQYLANPDSAERIKAMIPDVRLVALLRDPADRAFSSYMMYVRDMHEKRLFLQAVDDEIAGNLKPSPFTWLSYLGPGLYGQQLEQFLRVFDREQVFIGLYEDLRADPLALMRRVYRFLEIDEDFTPDMGATYNASGKPKNKLIARLTRKSKLTTKVRQWMPEGVMARVDKAVGRLQAKNLEKVRPEPEAIAKLRSYYAEDVRLLSRLIDRDLSAWIEPKKSKPTSG